MPIYRGAGRPAPRRGRRRARPALALRLALAAGGWLAGADVWAGEVAPAAPPLRAAPHRRDPHPAATIPLAGPEALSLDERRRRFFGHVDEVVPETPVVPTTTTVFPVGPDGLPLVSRPPKLRGR